MKQLVKLVLTVSLLASGITAPAQEKGWTQRLTTNRGQRPQSGHSHVSREELAQRQSAYIASQLELDEATSRRFYAVYSAYQQEVWALGPRRQVDQQDVQTDEEAEAAIRRRMERSQQMLALRQKYYARYSEFLSQRQIQRLYELERQTMRRLAHKRTPNNR